MNGWRAFIERWSFIESSTMNIKCILIFYGILCLLTMFLHIIGWWSASISRESIIAVSVFESISFCPPKSIPDTIHIHIRRVYHPSQGRVPHYLWSCINVLRFWTKTIHFPLSSFAVLNVRAVPLGSRDSSLFIWIWGPNSERNHDRSQKPQTSGFFFEVSINFFLWLWDKNLCKTTKIACTVWWINSLHQDVCHIMSAWKFSGEHLSILGVVISTNSFYTHKTFLILKNSL